MRTRYRRLLLLSSLGVAAVAGGGVTLIEERLTGNDSVVLRHNHKYVVDGRLAIDAKDCPGTSALRVPAGEAAILVISNADGTALLEVCGGPGYGRLPAGAGIEVPVRAKLVICGNGELTAKGGDAAPGTRGYSGVPGLKATFMHTDSLADSMLPVPRSQLPASNVWNGISSDLLKDCKLPYGRIGGGGYGGAGGVGPLSQLVINRQELEKQRAKYENFITFYGMGSPYVYDIASSNEKRFLCDSETGLPGGSGGNGSPCGEVIIAGSVTVTTESGEGGGVGDHGYYGATAVATDEEFSSGADHGSGMFAGKFLSISLGLFGTLCGLSKDPHFLSPTAGFISSGLAVVMMAIDYSGVGERRALRKLLRYCGGGGGGGGLFVAGAGSIYAIGDGSKPDTTTPPLDLSGHGGKG